MFREQSIVSDLTLMGLSENPEEQEFLPPSTPCPHGHTAWRHFHYGEHGHRAIPYFVCYECTVVYRWHELLSYREGA